MSKSNCYTLLFILLMLFTSCSFAVPNLNNHTEVTYPSSYETSFYICPAGVDDTDFFIFYVNNKYTSINEIYYVGQTYYKRLTGKWVYLNNNDLLLNVTTKENIFTPCIASIISTNTKQMILKTKNKKF